MTQPTPATQSTIAIHILSHMRNPNGWCMTSIMHDIGVLTAQGMISGDVAQNMQHTRDRIITQCGVKHYENS